MEREKMKHAVPLTPFQDKLYDVVLQAFKEERKKEYNIREHPIMKVKLEKEAPAEPLPKRQKRSQVQDASFETGWKNKAEHVLECVIGMIDDHITGLFLLSMAVNTIWLQILSTWMIPRQNEGMQQLITILKYAFVIVMAGYILTTVCTKGRKAWEKLTKWAEESSENKEGITQ